MPITATVFSEEKRTTYLDVATRIENGRNEIKAAREFADAHTYHNLATAQEIAKTNLDKYPALTARRLMRRLDIITEAGEGFKTYFTVAFTSLMADILPPRAVFMTPKEAAVTDKWRAGLTAPGEPSVAIKATPYAVIDTSKLKDRHDVTREALNAQRKGVEKIDLIIDHAAVIAKAEGRADIAERFVNSRNPNYGDPFFKLTGGRNGVFMTRPHRMGIILEANAFAAKPMLLQYAVRMALDSGTDVIRVSGAEPATMAPVFNMIAGYNQRNKHKVLLSVLGPMSVEDAAINLALADRFFDPTQMRRGFRIASTKVLYDELLRMQQIPDAQGRKIISQGPISGLG